MKGKIMMRPIRNFSREISPDNIDRAVDVMRNGMRKRAAEQDERSFARKIYGNVPAMELIATLKEENRALRKRNSVLRMNYRHMKFNSRYWHTKYTELLTKIRRIR